MAFTAEVRQHLSSLAAGCARVIAARLAHGDLAAAHPKEAVYTLLDGLAESVLVVQAIRDADGRADRLQHRARQPGLPRPGRPGRAST